MLIFEEIEAAIRRGVVWLVGLVTAGLVLAVACGFLLAAMYLALVTVMEPMAACLVLGGALLVLVVVLLALTLRAASRVKPVPRQLQDEPAVQSLRAGAQLANSIRGMTEGSQRVALTALFLAGFAVGFSPRLRRNVLRWLRA